MGLDSLALLFSGLLLCFSIAAAGVARAAAREAKAVTRSMRVQLSELDVQASLNSAHIKRLTASVGALGRWTKAPKAETDDGLPDPASDPEKWRAAVRRMADHQTRKPKGALQ